MHHQPLIVRWSMPITIVVLFVLSFAPIRLIGWTRWFADQTQVTIAPIAHPITIAINAIIPPTYSDPAASDRERELSDELDRYRTQLLQIEQENDRLRGLIDQFSKGAAIIPDLDVRQFHRPRVSGLVGDLLVIRTGKIDGLTQGSVAVVNAVQLLGKVTQVNNRIAYVRPITAKSAQPIMATILLNESGDQQAKCLLRPVGDGTLRGEVARPTSDDAWHIQAGQEVRLLDDQWPAHAQMLVIGTVERIERNDNQPLRQRVIIRPTVKDLRWVPEVILRLPADSARESDQDWGTP